MRARRKLRLLQRRPMGAGTLRQHVWTCAAIFDPVDPAAQARKTAHRGTPSLLRNGA